MGAGNLAGNLTDALFGSTHKAKSNVYGEGLGIELASARFCRSRRTV